MKVDLHKWERTKQQLKNNLKLGQEMKRESIKLMNKKGRVTPNQVIGFMFRKVPLYRLQKKGVKTLKDPTWQASKRKLIAGNQAEIRPNGGQIRPNLPHSTECWSNSAFPVGCKL